MPVSVSLSLEAASVSGSTTTTTNYGYTGQRADSASGVDYHGARYYDRRWASSPASIRCLRPGSK